MPLASPGLFQFSVSNKYQIAATTGNFIPTVIATICRSNGTAGTVTVPLIVDLKTTAVLGVDYQKEIPKTVTFVDGQTSVDIVVDIYQNPSIQPLKNIYLKLGQPTTSSFPPAYLVTNGIATTAFSVINTAENSFINNTKETLPSGAYKVIPYTKEQTTKQPRQTQEDFDATCLVVNQDPPLPDLFAKAGWTLPYIPTGYGTQCNPSPAKPAYPLVIPVSGVTTPIKKITATLIGVNSKWIGELAALLVSPEGYPVELISGTGGAVQATDLVLSFDSTSTNIPPYPSGKPVTSGIFKPTTYYPYSPYLAPAPKAPIPGGVPYGSAKYSNNLNDFITGFEPERVEVKGGIKPHTKGFLPTVVNGKWSVYLLLLDGKDLITVDAVLLQFFN